MLVRRMVLAVSCPLPNLSPLLALDSQCFVRRSHRAASLGAVPPVQVQPAEPVREPAGRGAAGDWQHGELAGERCFHALSHLNVACFVLGEPARRGAARDRQHGDPAGERRLHVSITLKLQLTVVCLLDDLGKALPQIGNMKSVQVTDVCIQAWLFSWLLACWTSWAQPSPAAIDNTQSWLPPT